jgi:hypothetical protein
VTEGRDYIRLKSARSLVPPLSGLKTDWPVNERFQSIVFLALYVLSSLRPGLSAGTRGMTREALGEFEHVVLLAILHLGDGVYGVPIVDEIQRRTGRSVAPAAVYVTAVCMLP